MGHWHWQIEAESDEEEGARRKSQESHEGLTGLVVEKIHFLGGKKTINYSFKMLI